MPSPPLLGGQPACSSRIRSLEEEIKKHVKNVDELKVLVSIHVPPRFPVANAARRA
jgi:hypothetical protein